MTTFMMLRPGDVIARPKSFGLQHLGMVMPNGIFHNAPERGECLVTLEEFCAGRNFSIWTQPDSIRWAAVFRAQEMLLSPRSYNLFFWNCEHSVTFALTGNGESAQLQLCMTMAAVGSGLAAVAVKKNGPS